MLLSGFVGWANGNLQSPSPSPQTPPWVGKHQGREREISGGLSQSRRNQAVSRLRRLSGLDPCYKGTRENFTRGSEMIIPC